ncbi:hypothetical protein PanWU01x14_299780, partial [Parasponia andersonii]
AYIYIYICVCVCIKNWRERLDLEGKTNQNKGDLELGEEADMGVEERDRVGDLHDVVRGGDAAEEDAVDGGGLVLEGMEDQLYVRVLTDLVPQLATHDSVSSTCT